MNVRTLMAALLLSVLLAGLPACGNDNSDASDTPELLAALQHVDDAIVNEHRVQARHALRQLKHLAGDANDAGTLSDAQASDIVTAASQLVQDLRPTTSPQPTVSTTPSVTTLPPTKPEKDEKTTKPEKSEAGPGNSEDAPGHDKD